MAASFRQRVTRADGRTINVVQRRGHLSYCYGACCCGRTDRGYAAVPVEVYKEEWLKRKLRNVLHLPPLRGRQRLWPRRCEPD
jgi:cobaltochelatase CobN